MPHAPTTKRWTPVPDNGALDLLKAKQYTALAVWLCMLRDATRRHAWETTRSIAALQLETSLSRQTIVNAQNYLARNGYIRPVSGGGPSRKTVTFAVTPVPNYGGRPAPPQDTRDTKPEGDWTL